MGGEATPPTAAAAAAARVLIADDHPLAREGLRSMLAPEQDLEIVGEAEDGRAALELCRKMRPELVLMDVRMPGMDGLEATRRIKELCPKTAVLIVTTHHSEEYLLEAVGAGAAGYVLKEATKGELLGAVRRVLGGESPLNQELAMRLLRRLGERPPPGREAPRASTSPCHFPGAPRRGGRRRPPWRRSRRGRSRSCGWCREGGPTRGSPRSC